MAFALPKSSRSRKDAKRSPLAGWLGKAKPDEELPELDIAGGLSRALRAPAPIADKQNPEKDEHHPVRDALGAIEAALYAIDRIRDTLEQACEVALSAKDVEDIGGRALLAERYDELRLSVDYIIAHADPRAAVLIGGGQRHLDVHLGGKTRYSVAATPLDVSERGLGLTPPQEAFANFEEIERTLQELDRALHIADRSAASYCRDAQYLIARMNGALKD